MLIDVLSFVLLLAGGALVLVGGVGLLRFPDFYTRLHAASVTETLALTLIVLGLLLHAGWSLVGLKLLMVFVFMLATGPVATHALARAANHGRLAPRLASEWDESSSAEPAGSERTNDRQPQSAEKPSSNS